MPHYPLNFSVCRNNYDYTHTRKECTQRITLKSDYTLETLSIKGFAKQNDVPVNELTPCVAATLLGFSPAKFVSKDNTH